MQTWAPTGIVAAGGVAFILRARDGCAKRSSVQPMIELVISVPDNLMFGALYCARLFPVNPLPLRALSGTRETSTLLESRLFENTQSLSR